MKIKYLLTVLLWPIRAIWVYLYGLAMYLRGLLPHPVINKGERFFATEDISTHGATHWNAPGTFGFDCTIPKGTILIAYCDSARISSGFSCIPENKEKFEINFVPEVDRTNPKYNGYSFVAIFCYRE
jgi:hypothetical protein